ncbi:hypothetical protein SAMN04488104_105221 [Algoriphagus faecimaris]|uniref:DUF4221 domain-containing protein n=2 Tax=Algoriphagus faecimaris TaxID=686796 RepID=A0A1G6X9W3_9BACT|nr:hypothetical protein SAMN04488104_105221 [Algoriphagus faecimaris]
MRMVRSLFYLFTLSIPLISCNQLSKNESNYNAEESITLTFSKSIQLDISENFPKLQGNPLFFSDKTGSYFYIQTSNGIGTFDLQKGGKSISYLRLNEVENFRGKHSTGQNHFIPYSKDGFVYFERQNDEIYIFENGKSIQSQKLARIIGDNPKPLSGVLKFAVKPKQLITALNMAEIFAKPPFIYQNQQNTIGVFDQDLQEFDAFLPLPAEYIDKKVNVYDLLFSMDYIQNEDEFMINFPVSDSLIFTRDFKNFDKIAATPKKGFVKMDNRSGIHMGEWKKEYYTDNTFFTSYYDSFRDLYIRHYRKALSESEFELVEQNSFKMFHPKNENFLLFLDREGNHLHTMDVSDFNHLYVHFGKEGMYILNDTELENEDLLTFSLFNIEKN